MFRNMFLLVGNFASRIRSKKYRNILISFFDASSILLNLARHETFSSPEIESFFNRQLKTEK